MRTLVSSNPFEFIQLMDGSKVTSVLLPTFIDVVFYDEQAVEATGYGAVCNDAMGSESFSLNSPPCVGTTQDHHVFTHIV